MSRPAAALLPLAALALACNDYQFAPVGHCIVQPGAVRVTLPDIASADILFVVDDSPSMDPKQAGLAASFQDFITRIVEANTSRAAKGLQPVDFRIAVTTSSIFSAAPASTYCAASGGAGQCCQISQCVDAPSCTRGTSTGCAAGQLCVVVPTIDAGGNLQNTHNWCCAPSSCSPSSGCAAGDACPVMTTSYPASMSGCTPGLATPGEPYPAGVLVAAPGNPKVLEFSKQLGWASWGTATPDPALTTLVRQFQQNIQVGSCGSGEEQHLEAARLALEKGIAGQQPGVSTPFPRQGVKLVVVWVGDEDDCSSPPSAPVVMWTFNPGADACVWDKHRTASDQRELPVTDYAAFLDGLVSGSGAADLAVAFIVSSARCTDGSYAPADSCSGTPACPVTPPAACGAAPVCTGAYAAGERFLALADIMRSEGRQVIEGTVCDAYPPASFGPVLQGIAGITLPPNKLELPSLPAARAVTAVVILTSSGATKKVCAQGTDWCFVDCADTSASPACLLAGTSRCIAINHATGQCEADAGETYQAEYLGFVPEGGCATSADCRAALGGAATDWTCVTEPGQSRGTCSCQGAR